ncbi:hypothetical protein ACIQCJ_35475 [Streptomyces sp. NPDC093221]|uniref:hypothetical protein n=1 Tax=Streptomyces sp. NPDC093221 TaxID=3366032 RepID=UPI0038155359
MNSALSLPNERHQRLLAMRAERRTLGDADVEAAIEEVDSSGLVALLEEFVHLNRGRRRTLHLRAFLVGAHLCSQMHNGRIVLEQLTDILYFRIGETLRQRLSIPDYPDHDQGFEAGYAVVRRLFKAMVEAMNPSPLPPNKHLTRAEAEQLVAAADPSELAVREERLAFFTEFVLDASVRQVKDLLPELSDCSIAVDATPIRTYSRGRRTGGPELATDPDAGWYVREGDHRDPAAAPVADAMRPAEEARPSRRATSSAKQKKGGKQAKGKKTSLKKKAAKYLFGYDAALAVTRDSRHDDTLLGDNTPDPNVLPALVLGLSLDKPGCRPGYNGLKAIKRLRDRGYPPGYLAGDTAYNNSTPAEWQLPVLALATNPSTTTAATSSASKPTPKARSSSKAPGTARRCRSPSSTPPQTSTPDASTATRGGSASPPVAPSVSWPKRTKPPTAPGA